MEFRILTIVSILMLFVSVTSCTKDVHVDIPGFEEKVVIEGSIETDGSPFVLISKNKNVYAPSSQADILGSYLPGAKVWVSDGTTTVQLTEICTNNLPEGMDTTIANMLGFPVEVISQVGICAYVCTDPNFKGEVGKTYSLKVVFEGKTYEASSTIHPPILLSDAYWKEETKEELKDYGYIYYTVDDPATERNAYSIEVKRTNLGIDGKPIDGHYFKPYGNYFDDEFFNGKPLEMSISNPMTYNDTIIDSTFQGYYHRGDTVSLKFSTYDYSIYRFLYAVSFQQTVGGGPFSTPINPVGNIPGAFGAWIAYSPSYRQMVCE